MFNKKYWKIKIKFYDEIATTNVFLIDVRQQI